MVQGELPAAPAVSEMTDEFRLLVSRYGDDPRAMGWVSRDSQERRFAVIAEVVRERDDVLDVGCGAAHLHDYLRERGWEGRYEGIDPMPEMVAVAQAAGRPARVGDLETADAGDAPPETFDVVVSSGVVSMQLGTEEQRYAWLGRHLAAATRLARRAVVVNFLAPREGGWQSPNRWFPRPGSVLDVALGCVRVVTVRHDYYDDIDCTLVLHLGGGEGVA